MTSGTIFVASNGALVLSRDNGLTFSNADASFDDYVKHIIYAKSKWIVGAASKTNKFIYTSTDTVSWTLQTNHPFTTVSYPWKIGCNGSYFVICTNDGKIVKSIDGIAWSIISDLKTTYPTFGLIRKIIWNGSFWIAGIYISNYTSTSATLIKSPDGISWSDVSSLFSSGPYDIAYNGSYYLASGTGGSGGNFIATSLDGINNWTLIPFTGNSYAISFVWNGSFWIALGLYGSAGTGVLKSTDGINWSRYIVVPSLSAMDIVWNGTYFTNLNYNNIRVSTDGVSWTQQGGTYNYTGNGGYYGSILYQSTDIVSLTAPGAPTGVSAIAGTTSATVSWAAPASNGDSAITGYTVTPSVGSPVTVGNVLTATLTGLASGTAVTFTVVATNSVGSSSASLASSSVTPTASATAPGAPTDVSGIAGIASATVSWTAPVSNGGSAITGYTVTPSVGSPVTVGNVLTATVTGLANGTAVTFTVVAINSVGSSSPSSASASVTPTASVTATAPGAPTGVRAVAVNASASVSWTAPASNGGSGIIGYTVTPSVGSPVTVGNILTAMVTGLTNGKAVTFTVVAINSVGSSSASSASSSVTPTASATAKAPGAPTGVIALAGNASASVSWAAPASNGGSGITGYTVTPSVGSPVTVDNVLTTTVTGLTNGKAVTFRVVAINSVGSSLASSASSSVNPTTTPGAPTDVTAVAGNASASISWKAPASNGGSAITGYTVTSSVGITLTVGNVLKATLTGLAIGTVVTFTVLAINSAGRSSASSPSSSVIPLTVPGGPTGVTAVAGNTSASVSWTAPSSNVGSTITGYKVICVPDNKKPNLAGPNDRSLLVIGLKNTVLTIVTVVALNAAGQSVQSNAISFTPYPLPGVPKVIAVRGTSGVINLSWTAKASHLASPITGYIVSFVTPLSEPVGMVMPTPTVTATGGSVGVSGLTNGSYYVFSVKSVSNIGQSLAGLSKGIIAAGPPDAPTAVVGTKGLLSAQLTWLAPVNTGGLPITGYIISYTVAGVVKTVNVKAVLTTIIKGLVNGTTYTFTIKAISLAGNSVVSSPVTVTPGTGL